MTKEELFKGMDQFYNTALALSSKKNQDYAPGENAFGNLVMCQNYGVSPRVGFLVRMIDKMSRLSSFVKNGELAIEDEQIRDTLLDLANYCNLWANWEESRRLPDPSTESKDDHFYKPTKENHGYFAEL